MDDTFLPCRELQEILIPAFKPCRHFESSCLELPGWHPKDGHVPRGCVGALGELSDVRAVFVRAEPADPLEGQRFPEGPPLEVLRCQCRQAYENLHSNRPTHTNMRLVLDLCFVDFIGDLRRQLRHAWLTQSVLCSLFEPGSAAPPLVEHVCGRDYLRPQLECLKGAIVVALGTKAARRIEACGWEGEVLRAHAVARPGCYQPGARPSWERIAERVRSAMRK